MKKLMTVALAGMLALTGGKALRADAPAVKTEKPAAPAAAPLSDESLAEMLTVMGYEFKAEPIKGTVIYHVTLNQDGWTWYVDFALSTDKQQLWITTNLATLVDENVPAAAVLRLLEESNNIGPTTITYNKKTKRIGIALPLFNRGGISPVAVRTYLNDFMVNGKSVMKLCDFAKPAEKTTKVDTAK